MKLILIFGISFLIKNALSDELTPPEPLSMDQMSMSGNGLTTEAKETPKKGGDKPLEKNDDASADKKQEINVKPATPIVTGGDGKPTVQQAEPTVRSVKLTQPGEETSDAKDKTASNESKSTLGLEDLPQNILDSVKQDEKSLRGGNTEIKPEKESESKEEAKGDKSDQEKPKSDPILESIEGAEKQLSEAFSAVRSKIMSMGKGQKPIKVDCGTTRVRVVCSKKGEPEFTETPEITENPEKMATPKTIIEPKAEPKKETETEKTEEKQEGEKEAEKGESEESNEAEEE